MLHHFYIYTNFIKINKVPWLNGKAPVYGTGDWEFESLWDRFLFLLV